MSRPIDQFDRVICLEITRRVVDGQPSNVSKSVERLTDSPAEMKNRFPFEKFHLWLRHRTAEHCLRAFIFLVPRIPPSLRVPITSAVAPLTLAIFLRYRKLLEQNVSIATSHPNLPGGRRKTVGCQARGECG